MPPSSSNSDQSQAGGSHMLKPRTNISKATVGRSAPPPGPPPPNPLPARPDNNPGFATPPQAQASPAMANSPASPYSYASSLPRSTFGSNSGQKQTHHPHPPPSTSSRSSSSSGDADPIPELLSILTIALNQLSSSLSEHSFPPLSLHTLHPLDDLDELDPPSVFEARRTALGALEMLKAHVTKAGEALMEMSMRSYDQAAYLLTNRIGVLETFQTEREKRRGLHIDTIVDRLAQGKKVSANKLERSLRLLTSSHWWSERSPSVFAPTRFALLNAVHTPTWAWAFPISDSAMRESVEFTDWAMDSERERKEIQENQPPAWDTPVMRAWGGKHSKKKAKRRRRVTNAGQQLTPFGSETLVEQQEEEAPFSNFYEWLESEPSLLARHALSMKVVGSLSLPSTLFDYPWDLIVPGSTLVDVGSGVGSVGVSLLETFYHHEDFKVVLQDRGRHLMLAKRYWEEKLPQALADGRVTFEDQDWFDEQPQQRFSERPVFLLRSVLQMLTDDQCIRVLRRLRAACHPDSKILVNEVVMESAAPNEREEGPRELSVWRLRSELESINDYAAYRPMSAPPPLPRQYGAAFQYQYRTDVIMMMRYGNTQLRTPQHMARLAAQANLHLDHICYIRGPMAVTELVPVP